MILILHPDVDQQDIRYAQLIKRLESLPNVQFRVHEVAGAAQRLTEIYLIGDTKNLDISEFEGLPLVARAVRVSREYRVLGRHAGDARADYFEYNGVRFGQDNFNLMAGLCAVNTRDDVASMMRALQAHGQVCTRMGAYKPRTSPYAFQGLGADCLDYVFDLAGQYGIRVIAMEVTHDAHIDEIDRTLERLGRPTGVMLQIGTRNTQNFELLKAAGRQHEYPVLIKRGFGITLEESLNAAEYLASEGNHQVVFCLRGVKSHLGDPHRNLVDFGHVPVVRRLTRMPVAIDPSHSVGTRAADPDGITDIFNVTAQGIVAGANLVLVDFHPAPERALVDGAQALTLAELPWYLDDIALARECFEARRRRAQGGSV